MTFSSLDDRSNRINAKTTQIKAMAISIGHSNSAYSLGISKRQQRIAAATDNKLPSQRSLIYLEKITIHSCF
jgi:hypothetical protein